MPVTLALFLLAAAARPSPDALASWLALDAPAAIRAPETDAASPRGLREARAAELLASLAEIPAVPEREAPVRRRVLERLPEWARGLECERPPVPTFHLGL